ncbi:hypothetical protein [Rubrimonas cliftonensis]|uniref:hypothetical protein n=1 Tax=Rubrimonas cliftonensis TaxID=89524 RepID=UPI001114AC57|nr:hypothetical protein [Rubrimonas cliftonensis]
MSPSFENTHQELELSQKKTVWTRADIALATQEARGADSAAEQVRALSAQPSAAPTERCNASMEARASSQCSDMPRSEAESEPPRYARIIKPAAKRADHGVSGPTGAFAADRDARRAEAAAARSAAPTVASVFSDTPVNEPKAVRALSSRGRSAEAKTSVGPETQTDVTALRRSRIRLSLPASASASRD